MQELEKILEEIENARNEYPKACFPWYVNGMRDAENIIRNHMDDGWIPVEERLPEDGTYLCTLKGELCGIEEPFTGMCGIENGIWDEPDCVIAWCPIPEPYQPKPQNKPEDHYPDWRAKLLNKFDRRE